MTGQCCSSCRDTDPVVNYACGNSECGCHQVRVRYPDVRVHLTGLDGNAYAIIGAVRKALLRAGVSKEHVSDFFKEATSGDYDHVLQTCMRWVEVE